jgi:hypothetical protein
MPRMLSHLSVYGMRKRGPTVKCLINAVTGQVPRPLRIVLTEFRLQIEPTSERCEAGNLISKTLDFAVFDVWFGSKWKMHGKRFEWVFYFRAESATPFGIPLF